MPNVADRLLGATSTLGCKAPVQAATTAEITLSGEQAVDGVALVEGDRCLVKDQSDATENGLYTVATSAWALAKDFDGTGDWRKGTIIPVAGGSTNAGTIWRVSSADPDSIGEDDVDFEQLDFTSVEVSGSVATGSSVNLNSVDAEIVSITGSGATIATISVADGVTKIVRFEGQNTLTHSSTLALPGSKNIVTAAGDFAIFCGFSSSTVRCAAYSRVDNPPPFSQAKVNTTQTPNSTTSEVTLIEETVPASRLSSSGAALKIVAWGITSTSTAATKRARLYFGSATVVADTGAIALAGGVWRQEAIVARTTSAAVQSAIGISQFSTGGIAAGSSLTLLQTAPTEALTTDITVKVNGLATASTAQITAHGLVIEQLSV